MFTMQHGTIAEIQNLFNNMRRTPDRIRISQEAQKDLGDLILGQLNEPGSILTNVETGPDGIPTFSNTQERIWRPVGHITEANTGKLIPIELDPDLHHGLIIYDDHGYPTPWPTDTDLYRL